MRLCISSVIDQKHKRPIVVGVQTPKGTRQLYDIYAPGTGKPILQAEEEHNFISKLWNKALLNSLEIITSDFKSQIEAYDLPIAKSRYNVYDIGACGVVQNTSLEELHTIVSSQLDQMSTVEAQPYQLVTANAAVVYSSIQRRGVLHNGILRHPIWSQNTSTGRSSASVFNIQGIGRNSSEDIKNPTGKQDDVLIHFDWISADMRVAAYFSKDESLRDSFLHSDPYVKLSSELGLLLDDEESNKIVRSECKLALLKSVNSMNSNNPVFNVYHMLGKWIENCRMSLDEGSGLSTILGREFRSFERSDRLKVFNASMQGSIANAMQSAVRRIWEEVGDRLIAEIHDSLVISCSANSKSIRDTINKVAPIMLLPFDDTNLDVSKLDFPVKVSIGKLWNSWKPLEIWRLGGVERIRHD